MGISLYHYLEEMEMGYYVYEEDLASGLIGPFPTIEAAKARLAVQKQRGDAAAAGFVAGVPAMSFEADGGRSSILPEWIARQLPCWSWNRVTLAEDLHQPAQDYRE